MTWKEIFTYGNELQTIQDKIKFYSVFVVVALFLGIGYEIVPFFYSKEYLVQQTKNDLSHFLKTDKVIESTRFSFLKKESKDNCTVFIAKSIYTPYTFSKIYCKEVQNEK